MAIQNATNRWAVSRFIVNKTAGLGTHTTVQGAIDDSVSGDMIFIMDGTYTEDLTVTDGVFLNAFHWSRCTIKGKLTVTATGAYRLNNILFETNGDFCLSVTGSNVIGINVGKSVFACTDNSGIEVNNANAIINFTESSFRLATTGIAQFAVTAASQLIFIRCRMTNSGLSTTSNSFAGAVQIRCEFCELENFIYSMTGSAAIFAAHSTFKPVGAFNQTSLTYGSNASSSFFKNTNFSSGTATALVLNTGTVSLLECTVNSSNTTTISGTGTLKYTPLSFLSSSNITVSTQTRLPYGPDMLVGGSCDGLDNLFTVDNESDTASSTATIQCQVAGSTGGDCRYEASVSGGQSYSWGIDNSVTTPAADPFVVSASAALGTTDVMVIQPTGEITKPLQPAFQAYLGTADSNVTGDGTAYVLGSGNALTELKDQGSDFATTGIFTAPVDGMYLFTGIIQVGGLIATHVGSIRITTSNRAYIMNEQDWFAISNGGFAGSEAPIVAEMDAADTEVVQLIITGATKVVDIIGSANQSVTSGCLLV